MRLLVLFIALTIVGCTHVADRYSMSGDNVAAIRAVGGQSFNVGAFGASQGVAETSISCAAVAISPPDNISFAEYIRSALVTELKIANAYSTTSPTTITGNIEALEVDASALSLTGQWRIVLKASVNGKVLSVTEQYIFRSQSLNMTACEGASRRLGAAVQNLLGKLVAAPEFAGVVRSR